MKDNTNSNADNIHICAVSFCAKQYFIIFYILIKFLFFDYRTEPDKSYFYLYQISYMWYCPLGFFLAIAVGWLTSWITRWIFKEDQIEVDPSLFSPIVANRVQKRQKKMKEFRSNALRFKN